MKLHDCPRCPECKQALAGSYTVCADYIVRCLDCGRKTSGNLFSNSVAMADNLLLYPRRETQ